MVIHILNTKISVRYAVPALRREAYLDNVLGLLLVLLMEEKGEAENPAGTYNFLSKIYNMESLGICSLIYKYDK